MALIITRKQAWFSRSGVGCGLSFLSACPGGRIYDTLFLPFYVHSGVPAAHYSMAPRLGILVYLFTICLRMPVAFVSYTIAARSCR